MLAHLWPRKILPRSRVAPRIRLLACGVLLAMLLWRCGTSEMKPVALYPEDMCSQCRMAISESAFAAEIITNAEEIYKFDDLGCLMRFKERTPDLAIAATFAMNYATRTWLPWEQCVVLQTRLKTPMGSGLVAFADSTQAQEVLAKLGE